MRYGMAGGGAAALGSGWRCWVALVDGWVAHRHAGLAAAVAGGGRRRGEGERCVPGPIQKIGCARDFVPLISAATVALWPSSSQLSTQEDPFFI